MGIGEEPRRMYIKFGVRVCSVNLEKIFAARVGKSKNIGEAS